MIKLKNMIPPSVKESPDRVEMGTKDILDYADFDAYTFGYTPDGVLRIGLTADEDDIGNDGYGFFTHQDIHSGGREALKFPGRPWINRKVISFWNNYPSKSELLNIFKDVEKNLNISIIPTKWKIDVPNEGKTFNLSNDAGHLVSFSKYERPDVQHAGTQHVVSPMKKKQREVPDGMGSKKLKAGMPLSQYNKISGRQDEKKK